MATRSIPLLTLLLAASLLSPTANATPSDTLDYWTPERMATATSPTPATRLSACAPS